MNEHIPSRQQDAPARAEGASQHQMSPKNRAWIHGLWLHYSRYMHRGSRNAEPSYVESLESWIGQLPEICRRQTDIAVSEEVMQEVADTFAEMEIGSVRDALHERVKHRVRVLKKPIGSSDDNDTAYRPRLGEPRISSLVALASVLLKRGVIKHIEQLSSFAFKKYESSEVPDVKLAECTMLYAENYAENPALRDRLITNFNKIQRTSRAMLHTLECEGRIVAFDRFDVVGRDFHDRPVVHFGAMNVSRNLRGQSLGGILMDESLNPEAQSNPIIAECDLGSQVALSYINDRGFVGTAIFRDWLGITMMWIQKDEQTPHRLITKEWTDEEILQKLGNHTETYFHNLPEVVHIKRGKPQYMPEIFPSLSQEDNVVLTRIVEDGDNIIAVFEGFPDVISPDMLTVDRSKKRYVDAVLDMRHAEPSRQTN